MSGIKYEFGNIEAGATDINKSATAINSELDELKKMLQPLVSSWEGESATAYNEAQSKWDKAAKELNQILATISKSVDESNNRMSHINKVAANSWG